jgi:prepilin-type N-terminal cleavage/methylation domain-containing protein
MMKRAFTLAELMVAMGILALVTGLAVIPLRRNTTFSRANPDAVAAVVASEFRSARLRALSKSIPVAVVIPSESGTRAHAQSLYVLEGFLPGVQPRNPVLPPEPPPKLVRVIDFSKEYPGVYLYSGLWNVDTTALVNPALTPAIGDSTGGTLEGWLKPASKDYQYVFTPDGRLLSNDLCHFDGSFHLLVAANLDYALSAPPPGPATMTTPPSYFNLTAVHRPVTLSINLQGGVSTAKELVAGTGVSDCGLGTPAVPAAAALVQSPVTNTAPQIADVSVLPPPNPALSGGFDAVVRPDGFLTLVLRIVDSQGDQVTCSWQDVVVIGPGPGTFTVPAGRQSIEYDQLQGCWVATCIWQPPVNAVQGNQFQLTATVTDSLGASFTLTGSAVIDVETRNAGRFFFSENGYICSLNGDGSSIRRLTRGTDPEVSPDGSKVAFLSGTDITLMNADGTDVELLQAGNFGTPSWSPDGLYLTFDEDATNVRFLRVHDATLSNVTLPGTHPRWSSQDILVYEQLVGTVTQLFQAPLVASDLFLATPVAPTPAAIALPAPFDTANVGEATWSNLSGYLTFSSGSGIYSCDVAGTSVVSRYTPTGGYSAQRAWMMVGEPATKMVFVESNGTSGRMKLCDVDLSDANPAGAPVVLRSGKLNGSCSWGP